MSLRHDFESVQACNQSEKTGYHAIKKALGDQMPMTRVLSNVILPLEPENASKAPATAEYDTIAVTPYGLIVFEIKDWKGYRLSKTPVVDGQYRWNLEFEPGGASEVRRNAVGQCYGKTRHLAESIGFWATSYVVITDDNMILDHHLGAHVILQKELGYVPRLIHQISKKIQNGRIPDGVIDKVADAILENSAGLTHEQHAANVLEYLSLNNVQPQF